MTIDPRQLPEMLMDAKEFHGSGGPDNFRGMIGNSFDYDTVSNLVDLRGQDLWDLLWESQLEAFGKFQILYVTSDMTEKIIKAAESMPSWVAVAEDAPIPDCFAYFEGLENSKWSGGTRTSSALSWEAERYGDVSRFVVGHYNDLSSGSSYPYKNSIKQALKQNGIRPARMFQTAFCPWQYRDSDVAEIAKQERHDTMSFLKAAWLIMQQEELIEASETEPSRNSAKRIRRQGGDPGKVRIVDIKRKRYTGNARDREGYAREYDHRWKVRGHWRNQWYPSRGVHRPKWIEEHVRGPEDAPLIERDTVYRLK